MSGIGNFDANNEAHVSWLRESFEEIEKFNDPSHRSDIVRFFENAPFKLKVKNPLDIPMIHSFIALAYARAVLLDKN